MCGISGILSTDRQLTAETQRSVVERIVEDQLSRGPDYQAVESVRGETHLLTLGHNRLSIIDLTAEANQPMWDDRRRFGLVYNGEIYNYLELRDELIARGCSFVTQSDSEVIIEAFRVWGPEALSRFNGMFAFALWDGEARRLWLCRDRFGVKPLFYACDGKTLYFASSGRVLAGQLKLEPNLEYVARGLQYWVYEDDSDIGPYEGLMALPAGHVFRATVADGRLETERFSYYNLAERVEAERTTMAGESDEALIRRIGRRLDRAVTIRLRSDVPVGVSLSGGLDSSTVTAFLIEKSVATRGFTFGNPHDSRSEGSLVRELTRDTNVDVTYISPPASALALALWDTLKAQDAPFANPSVIAQHLVFKAAREHQFKVLLGGQGGDEAFMGYRKFQLFQLRHLVATHNLLGLGMFLPGFAAMICSQYWRAGLSLSSGRRYSATEGLPFRLDMPRSAPLIMSSDLRAPLWHRQLLDVTRLSLPTLLRYEDRNSMGRSIESRLPFLDYRLVEMGLALPESLKVRNGFGKWVIRQLMKGRIPESIRSVRFKKAFDVDLPTWIRNGLGEAMRGRLADHRSAIRQWLPAGTTIERAFSDTELVHQRVAVPEAISLLWLAGVGDSSASGVERTGRPKLATLT